MAQSARPTRQGQACLLAVLSLWTCLTASCRKCLVRPAFGKSSSASMSTTWSCTRRGSNVVARYYRPSRRFVGP
eukprot:648877-Amphidinium_carterae.1